MPCHILIVNEKKKKMHLQLKIGHARDENNIMDLLSKHSELQIMGI